MADINKITTTYTDGTTVITASLLNELKNKINEVVDKVNGESPSPTPTPTTVSTPVITISGSTATITCATSGATIRYAIDSVPSQSSGTIISNGGTVALTQACTIKAIAYKDGVSSSVASESYSPSAPSVSININAPLLSISAPSGATIKYTLDGTEPSVSAGSTYTTPVQLTGSCTVKAVAILNGIASEVATQNYTAGNIAVSSIVEVGQGSVSGTGNYAEGNNVSLLAVPASGYEFATWRDSGDNPRSIEVGTEDVEYKVGFLPVGGTVIEYFAKQNHVLSRKSLNTESSISIEYTSSTAFARFYPITAGKRYEIITISLSVAQVVYAYIDNIPSTFPSSGDSAITVAGKMPTQPTYDANRGLVSIVIESAENHPYLMVMGGLQEYYIIVKQMN